MIPLRHQSSVQNINMGRRKRTRHLAKILKQRKVAESTESDSTIITIPNMPSCTSSIATTSRTQSEGL